MKVNIKKSTFKFNSGGLLYRNDRMLKWQRTKKRAKKKCVDRSCYVICKGLADEREQQ